MLAPADPIDSQRTKPLPPSEIVGGEERYEVEEVIDSRVRHGRLQYLVRWEGYGPEENSWLLEMDLNAADLVMDFYRVHPTAPKQINTLTFGRIHFQP
jgi:hypothetical protein